MTTGSHDPGQIIEELFPGWTVRRCERGRGLTAHHPDGRRLHGIDPVELLLKLDAAEQAAVWEQVPVPGPREPS
jgi:hypothetical protein